MKKQLFSIFLAVVMIATAVLVLPKPQATQAYTTDTKGTHALWDNSYHSLVEGRGDKGTGYIGKNAYTMTQSQNEYDLSDQFAVTVYNECDFMRSPNNNAEAIRNSSESAHEISVSIGNTPVGIQNLTTGKDRLNFDSNQACRIGLANNYVQAQEHKNTGTRFYNIHNIDLTEYRYLRFQIYCERIELDPTVPASDRYFRVFWRDANGNTMNDSVANHGWQSDISTQISPGNTYDCLIDITNVNGIPSYLDVHLCNVRRSTTNISDNAALWIDNIRLIKNTTLTEFYSYQPTVEKRTFHDCASTGNVWRIAYSNYPAPDSTYDLDTTTLSTPEDTNKAVVIWPKSAAWGKSCWYQLEFGLPSGEFVRASDYSYFRFYFTLGGHVPIPDNFVVYFSDTYNFSTYEPRVVGDITSFKGDSGWYMITLGCSNLNMDVRRIRIQFGALTISRPGADGSQNPLTIHLADMSFFRYNYQPREEFSYLPGHYQLLEGFESPPDSYADMNILSYCMNRENTEKGIAPYKKNDGFYEYYKNNNASTRSQLASGFTHQDASNKNQSWDVMIDEHHDSVTQGQKSLWFRPSTTSTKTSSVIYKLGSNNNPVDLSKFSYFSVDLTIRNPHYTLHSDTAYKYPPGMVASNSERQPKIRLQLNSKGGGRSYVDILLEYAGNTDAAGGWMTSTRSTVQGFPLNGFIPGNTGNYGPGYTPTGSMRFVVNLEDTDLVVSNGSNFDITKVESFEFAYMAGYKDSRNIDFFLDNLVAFTPDLTLAIQNTGVDETLDPGQRLVYTVKGHDIVSEHVNIEFSMEANETEIIEHLPYNGYTVTQQPWAWRYLNNKEIYYDSTTAPTRNGTGPDDVHRVTPYSDICKNRSHLYRTVIFDQTRHHDKWLDNNGYTVN